MFDKINKIRGDHKPSDFTPHPFKKISIFTLTMNRLEYTKRFIDCLERFTHVPYEHIIIDQASTDGTIEYLDGLRKNNPQKYKIIFNDINKGSAYGNVQAMEVAKGDLVARMDNDIEVKTN